jgi:hypothetical protein
MSIRKLALTAVVIAGVLGFAGRADAQVVYAGGCDTAPAMYSSYYAPTYSAYAPGVSYSSYYTPAYSNWNWGGYSYPSYSGYYRSYYPGAYYSSTTARVR